MDTNSFWQAVIGGIATGLGVGISNWLFIKRVEYLEKKILQRLNGHKRLKKGS